MASGIYEIVNLTDGKRYVGSAVDLNARWRRHLYYLRRGRHHSPHLQRAFIKYGESGFEFRAIEYCDREILIEREQVAIDRMSPEYNVEKVAGSRLGRKHSEETRAKMRASHANRPSRPTTDETRRKIGDAQRGKKRGPYKPRTPEHCAAIAAARRGKKYGPRKKKQPELPASAA